MISDGIRDKLGPKIHAMGRVLEAVIGSDWRCRRGIVRLVLDEMHPGRADIIGTGVFILPVVMQRMGASTVVESEHDILDGICYSLLSRSASGDV